MAGIDVVIAWSFATVPLELRAAFQRPTIIIDLATPAGRAYQSQLSSLGWPRPVRTILRNPKAHGFWANEGAKSLGAARINRIATMGFSESCQGVRGLLSSADCGLLDTVIACDGIHSGFVGGEPNQDRSNVIVANLAPWYAFAQLAAWGVDRSGAPPAIDGDRHCIITHSSIPDQLYPPFKFASTTRTAAMILGTVFGSDPQQATSPELPDGLVHVLEVPTYAVSAGTLKGSDVHYPSTTYAASPDKYQAGRAGLLVLGYDNLDPTGIGDHRYQASRVLTRVLQLELIDRWNREDPEKGVCYGDVSAVSASVDAAGCTLGNPSGVTVPPSALSGDKDYSSDWKAYLPKAENTPPAVPGTKLPKGYGPDGEPPSRFRSPAVSALAVVSSLLMGLAGGVVGKAVVDETREWMRKRRER